MPTTNLVNEHPALESSFFNLLNPIGMMLPEIRISKALVTHKQIKLAIRQILVNKIMQVVKIGNETRVP